MGRRRARLLFSRTGLVCSLKGGGGVVASSALFPPLRFHLLGGWVVGGDDGRVAGDTRYPVISDGLLWNHGCFPNGEASIETDFLYDNDRALTFLVMRF